MEAQCLLIPVNAAQRQVRRIAAAAMLAGDDVVDLVAKPGGGLGELAVLAAMASPAAHELLHIPHRRALARVFWRERRAFDWRIMSSLLTRTYSSSSALSSAERVPSEALDESTSTRRWSSALKSSFNQARATSGESVPRSGCTIR